jgi:hypothetical protein
MTKNIFKLTTLFIATAIISFSSCTKKNDDPTFYSSLSVTHASPDAPAVDILIDNSKVTTAPFSYTNTTGYLKNLISGKRNIKVNVAGTTTNVINADITFEGNKSYSLFAIDSVSKLSTLSTVDDLTTPAAGKAHVRFIHLSPDAPAVDIAVVGGGPVVFPNSSFKQASAFTPLAAGTYNLEVRVAGTSTVALTLPPITVADGKIYTVFAKGFLTGTGTQALGAEIIVNN